MEFETIADVWLQSRPLSSLSCSIFKRSTPPIQRYTSRFVTYMPNLVISCSILHLVRLIQVVRVFKVVHVIKVQEQRRVLFLPVLHGTDTPELYW